jgi:hypothetical protein
MTFLLLLTIFFLAAMAYMYTPWAHDRIEKLTLEPGNRMLRIGFGQNENKWFFRIDFWFFGIRIK